MIKTKAELRADIEALELERRSFMEEVRHGTGEFNEEEAKSKLADFDKRRADLKSLCRNRQARRRKGRNHPYKPRLCRSCKRNACNHNRRKRKNQPGSAAF